MCILENNYVRICVHMKSPSKDPSVCPSSLAKYFHDLGAAVEERTHDIKLRRTNREDTQWTEEFPYVKPLD